MRKRDAIQKDIERLNTALANIRNELEKLSQEEAKAREQVGNELITNPQSKVGSKIVDILRKRDDYNMALEVANSQLRALNLELTEDDNRKRGNAGGSL